jgi:multidrug resistance efflux pump
MNETSPNGGPPVTMADRVRSLQITDAPHEQPRFLWVPWLLVLVLGCTTGYLAYQTYFVPPAEPEEAQAGQSDTPRTLAPGTGARADAASSGEIAHESKGHIIPAHKIQISPKVAGMVTKLNFEEGKRVQKGDILAELETVDYKADRDRAQAAVAAAWERYQELIRGHRPQEIEKAKAMLEEAKALRDQLKDEVRRIEAGGKAYSEDEQVKIRSRALQADHKVSQLEQEYDLMKEGPRKEKIDAAKFDYEAAQAELAKAQWRLDNCIIRAPVTGVILSKKAEEGDIVNPIAFNVSASLCEMADLSDLEVELKIQERNIAQVFVGQQCRIRPEAFQDRIYEGEVSKIIPAADRGMGAVPVRVKVLRVVQPKAEAAPDLKGEQGKYLRPDMGAIVWFLKPAAKKPATPPAEASSNGKSSAGG